MLEELPISGWRAANARPGAGKDDASSVSEKYAQPGSGAVATVLDHNSAGRQFYTLRLQANTGLPI
jgi:hypothetical protein